MKKESIKESLISYFFPTGNSYRKLYEQGGVTGATANKAAVDDPDKNVAAPNLDGLFSNHTSILFLTSPDKSGIIKRGGNLGFIELTETSMKSGLEIDLEDFQWWSTTEDFEKYLSETGRKYSASDNEWTSENDSHSVERKISSYSDFLTQKGEKENRMDENLFLGLGGSVTSKGMVYQREEANFQGGKLTESQKKYVKFHFTRNKLRNNKIMKSQLDLTKLKIGQTIEMFVTAFNPKTNEIDEVGMVGITFKITAVIPAQGSIAIPMVAGVISQIAPNVGQGIEGGYESVLQSVVDSIYGQWDELKDALSTTTGAIFASLGAIAAAYSAGFFTLTTVWTLVAKHRFSSRINALISGQGISQEAAREIAKKGRWYNRAGRSIANSKLVKFIKYPATAFKNFMELRSYNRLAKGTKDVTRGWKAIKHIAYGHDLVRISRIASKGTRIARASAGIAKWSNPVGWVLLAADAIGSYFNYTSDNQAPAWDPSVLGLSVAGKTDAMKNYSEEGNKLCKSAKNSFNPLDPENGGMIKNGENITLCWTENPDGGWGLALSFVVSVSTRTTMNLTKIMDFTPTGKNSGFALFLVNSVNSKQVWDTMKDDNLRFLFIKGDTFEEGYADDNIGAYYLGAKLKDSLLPIAYYGHCEFTEFAKEYADAKDQLVVIDEKAPDEYKFYFEDSESNVINVIGKKITNKDIEDASPEEVRSFFDVQPVSSYIGNPEDETEEERSERESMENSAKSEYENSPEDQEGEENTAEPEKEEVAQTETNENYKWYSNIDQSKPVTSFSEFKSIKESLLLEQTPEEEGENIAPKEELATEQGGDEEKAKDPISGVRGGINTAKEFEENFRKILDTIEKPLEFLIYFVELREYADPDLRDIYQPGTFTNFCITSEALTVSNNGSVENEVQVNNLDVLIDPRKGEYSFSDKDRESDIKDTDLGSDKTQGKNTILTSDITSASNRKSVSDDLPVASPDMEKEKEIVSTIQRVDPKILSNLEIEDWNDITSIKIIRDRNGEPETVKIKNKKAKIGDKARRFDKGDPNFETALLLAKADSERKKEEEAKEELSKR